MTDQETGAFAMKNIGRRPITPLGQISEMPRFGSDSAQNGTTVRGTGEILAEIRTTDLDRLTGLPGRAAAEHFLRLLPGAPNASQAESFCAALFIDLDNFRYVNDGLSHAAGDLVLAEATRRIRRAIPTDPTADTPSPAPHLLTRSSGDEFLLVLGAVPTQEDVEAIAERVRRGMAHPFRIGLETVALQCSIGIATAHPRGLRCADLLREANTALHHAKDSRRGGHLVFRDRMHIDARRRLRLEADLTSAVAGGQIEAAYQPIVALESGRAVSFEALARWHHPILGPIAPDEFIPIAEETGLVVPLAHTLLCRAIDLLERLSVLPGGETIRMNVNVSRRQLADAAFIPMLESLLRGLSLAPSRLCLEITESMVMTSKSIRDSLFEIKSLGVQLHLDDFGTGLSSLSLLRTLPFDGIKVDRSFIETAEDREAIAILHAIITLGRNLRKVTTAEGIETTTHMATVQALGCDLAQGFLLGRPVNAAGAAALLTEDFSSRVAIGRPSDDD